MKDKQRQNRPKVPERVASLMVEPQLAAAWNTGVEFRRRCAEQVAQLLAYWEHCSKEAEKENAFAQLVAEQAAVKDASFILEMSEYTAAGLLTEAKLIRDTMPIFWGLFTSGAVDREKLCTLGSAIRPIEDRPDLLEILDTDVAEIAPGKTPAELKRWLKRKIPTLDIELFEAQVEKAVQDRYVSVRHGEDGVSLIQALLPTPEAEAIAKKLRAAARSMDRARPKDCEVPPPPAAAETLTDPLAPHQPVAEPPSRDIDHDGRYQGHDPLLYGDQTDERTLQQREADLFSAWLRDGHCYGVPISAKICVMVPEETLTGESNEPAIGADRSWVLPAPEFRKLAADPAAEHQWYTAGTRPNPKEAERDILSVVYNGRFPPDSLRDAIIFRDGTCQAPGCVVSAERSDLDHQIPFERAGATTASNLWALCRRHHKMKSHGYLEVPKSATPVSTGFP
ncbi:DUF222 domain-containing protein [Nesterenkonia sp. MY13]|uniref:DUF222 domain-containing protein n=1 Tax=Nesterenkonia sedimenti TaxID=1463632 RepID=A0A7X8THL3_9MICC|nr:HNH endonuclease signature motif containing protein [Nesterenkonia sedimenti]NLS08886.1 DUF222 domain-containing protein [Nesterenkonia sedimenti]